MKKIIMVCLALVVSIGGLASTARAEDWSYMGNDFTGYFHANPTNKNQWFERVSTGAVYSFKMTHFSPDFIDLFDASRGVTVRLCENACYIHHSGTGGRFIFLHHRTAPVLPPEPGQPLPAPGPGPEPTPAPTPDDPALPVPPAVIAPPPAPGPVEITDE